MALNNIGIGASSIGFGGPVSIGKFSHLVALLLAGISSTAFAQGAPAAEDSQAVEAQDASEADDYSSRDEIVVTARRREESLQEVPIAITAVTSEQLEERTIQDTNDLTAIVPGIRFGTGGTTGNAAIEARGQSRLPLGDLSAAVIVYFAEVPLPNEAVFIPTYDLSNIQALKGPQGTLFGRNALTGAVLLTPREPDFETTGYFTAGIGDYGYRALEMAVGGAVVPDKVAVRFAGEYRKRDGYVERVLAGDSAYSVNRVSLRGSLLLQPSETISNLTVLEYFTADEKAGAPILYALAPGLASGPFLNATFAQQQASGIYKTSGTGPQFDRRTIWGVTNRTTFDLSDQFTIKNIFGYRNYFQNAATDTDATPALLNHVASTRHGAQITEELQLVGKLFNERLDFIIGGFLYDLHPIGLYGNRSDVFVVQPWRQAYVKRKSKAVYGQFDYDFADVIPGLSLTAGLRYTKDNLEVCSLAAAGGSAPSISEENCATYPGTPPTIPPSSTVKTSYDALTYTFAANYKVNDDLLFYITHRKGFREGGINTPAFVTPVVTQNPPCVGGGTLCRDLRPYQTFGPQTNIDYEAGFKSDFHFGNAFLRLNVSAYETHHKDLQSIVVLGGIIDVTDPAAPPFGALTYNGGEVRVRGVEAEAIFRPFDALEFYGNLNYNKGKATKPNLLNIPGVVATLATARKQFNYGAGARVSLPLGNNDSKITYNFDWYHNGDNDEKVQPSLFIKSYDVVNMRLTYSKVGGSDIDVSAFVRNAFNERYVSGTSSAAPAFGFVTALVGEPRMFGVEATFRFGN